MPKQPPRETIYSLKVPVEITTVAQYFKLEEYELKYVKPANKWVIVVPGIGHISIDERMIRLKNGDLTI